MKRKIAVTTGTRAEYGILRPILREIQNSKKLELFLIVSGTHLSKNHGFTINDIKKDGFSISAKIPMMPKGNLNYHMSKTLGEGISSFSDVFKKSRPDISLILGDRDEALAATLAASHMNIPTAHVHGGDKTQAGIDEYNRHAITKLSNIHFPATFLSKKRILQMGENPKFVFLVGSPSIDELKTNNITTKSDLEKKYHIKFSDKVIMLLQHSVTTQSKKSREQIKATLGAIKKIQKTTIAIGPNSDAGHKEIFEELIKFSKKHSFFHFFTNLPRQDFLGFLKNVDVLVGNSSSGIIEGSYFNTSVVNIGIRQHDREHGSNIVHVKNFTTNSIHRNLLKTMNQNPHKSSKIYGIGCSSPKIRKILEQISINDELIMKQISY